MAYFVIIPLHVLLLIQTISHYMCFKKHSVMDDEIIMTRIGVSSYVYRNILSFDIITVRVTRGKDPYSSSNKSKQIVQK